MYIFMETMQDNLITLPILFISYITIEYYESKADNQKNISSLHSYAPIFGAILAIIPQCGFSILASMLFLEHKITIGTLISVFIATNDEALPILFSTPSFLPTLLAIIVGKVMVAICIGYLVDYFYHPTYPNITTHFNNKEKHSIIVTALNRTLKIYVFILLSSFIINYIVDFIGADMLSTFLWNDSVFQPLLAALLGFIPNCIVSILLSQLYILHSVSFASLFTGLMTNAGLGLIILYRYRLPKKVLVSIISILFISALLIGTILSIIA